MAITLDIPEVENVIDPRNIRSIKQNPLDVSNLSSFSKDEGRILENFSQRSRKWDDDLLEISETFIPSFPSDEEVIGIITMEDVIEELLQVSNISCTSLLCHIPLAKYYFIVLLESVAYF